MTDKLMTNFRLIAFGGLAMILLAITHSAFGQVDDYQPKTVLRKPIRAITDPPTTSAHTAEIGDNELVIGVEVNGQSRAYPINQLTGPSREIINDELGGTAIAATW
ncbi:MAG: DUF3179 domain-containing protein [Planctomycetes bacterium]|nr:DUF3179 domain-containing protein [Planctomycetota bacterium]